MDDDDRARRQRSDGWGDSQPAGDVSAAPMGACEESRATLLLGSPNDERRSSVAAGRKRAALRFVSFVPRGPRRTSPRRKHISVANGARATAAAAIKLALFFPFGRGRDPVTCARQPEPRAASLGAGVPRYFLDASKRRSGKRRRAFVLAAGGPSTTS
ncbi:hypothetical protein HPB50_015188 [Hyalomma asiaticum]|uniref:Uncharacterized protein n=1 Tax=Hyalomma asiaticum TaxID=266040 RepID=A0ACB7SR49_HYAAI|nr:hypothetical protein HPB50_015188 [Hyalomma asiaticum]